VVHQAVALAVAVAVVGKHQVIPLKNSSGKFNICGITTEKDINF
jgi:hypothetical protein